MNKTISCLLEHIKPTNQFVINNNTFIDNIKSWANDNNVISVIQKREFNKQIYIFFGDCVIKICESTNICYHNIDDVEQFLYGMERHFTMNYRSFVQLKCLLSLLKIKCNFDLIVEAYADFTPNWAVYDISLHEKYTLIKNPATCLSVGIYQELMDDGTWVGFARTLSKVRGEHLIYLSDGMISRNFAEYSIENKE